ncbi:hypothetical protein ACHAXN_006094 [Cyclotella atomus]
MTSASRSGADGEDRSFNSSGRHSNTIWSSVLSSYRFSESNAPDASIDTSADHELSSSLALSLDAAMIDSAVLSNLYETASPNIIDTTSAETELDALSVDSSSSISSCASVPDHSPHLFTNIGRALLQLSANENESVGGNSSASANDVSMHSRKRDFDSRCVKKDWWSKFQTEQDWEEFSERAAQYLSTLVSAELMEMDAAVERNRDPWTMKSTSDYAMVRHGCQRDSYSIAKMWLQRIYQTITSIMGTNPKGMCINRDTHMKMNYISYLVKELAIVQQRLNTLPPIPPSLPNAFLFGELPEGTRNLITQRCSAWRAETIKERELLELKQSNYREEIVSAIIEAEEELFWTKDRSGRHGLGACTDDGYFQVVDAKSSIWNDIDEDAYATERKCQIGYRYLIALMAGAAGIASVLLQSKRR